MEEEKNQKSKTTEEQTQERVKDFQTKQLNENSKKQEKINDDNLEDKVVSKDEIEIAKAVLGIDYMNVKPDPKTSKN